MTTSTKILNRLQNKIWVISVKGDNHYRYHLDRQLIRIFKRNKVVKEIFTQQTRLLTIAFLSKEKAQRFCDLAKKYTKYNLLIPLYDKKINNGYDSNTFYLFLDDHVK